MAATTRKWMLIVVAINLAISIIYGGGFINATGGLGGNANAVTWDNSALGIQQTNNDIQQQDDLKQADTSVIVSYMSVGLQAGWFAMKIVGLLLLGVPKATFAMITNGSTLGITSPLGMISVMMGMVFAILNIFFIYAIWFLIFKPKSD